MQTIAYETAIEVYNRIKSKPKTYTQLKNELNISNSTLSLCLQKLKNEDLIEKTIIDDEPHYTINKENFIEKLKSTSKDMDLTQTFMWLSSVAELDPEKYGIRSRYFKEIINKDNLLVVLEKNPPPAIMLLTKDKDGNVKILNIKRTRESKNPENKGWKTLFVPSSNINKTKSEIKKTRK